jgi:hypothetical protein
MGDFEMPPYGDISLIKPFTLLCECGHLQKEPEASCWRYIGLSIKKIDISGVLNAAKKRQSADI